MAKFLVICCHLPAGLLFELFYIDLKNKNSLTTKNFSIFDYKLDNTKNNPPG